MSLKTALNRYYPKTTIKKTRCVLASQHSSAARWKRERQHAKHPARLCLAAQPKHSQVASAPETAQGACLKLQNARGQQISSAGDGVNRAQLRPDRAHLPSLLLSPHNPGAQSRCSARRRRARACSRRVPEARISSTAAARRRGESRVRPVQTRPNRARRGAQWCVCMHSQRCASQRLRGSAEGGGGGIQAISAKQQIFIRTRVHWVSIGTRARSERKHVVNRKAYGTPRRRHTNVAAWARLTSSHKPFTINFSRSEGPASLQRRDHVSSVASRSSPHLARNEAKFVQSRRHLAIFLD